MTKKDKAERLKQISKSDGITPSDAAVANPDLAGGLEILAKEAAGATTSRRSGARSKKPAPPARPARGSGPAILSGPSAEDALQQVRR